MRRHPLVAALLLLPLAAFMAGAATLEEHQRQLASAQAELDGVKRQIDEFKRAHPSIVSGSAEEREYDRLRALETQLGSIVEMNIRRVQELSAKRPDVEGDQRKRPSERSPGDRRRKEPAGVGNDQRDGDGSDPGAGGSDPRGSDNATDGAGGGVDEERAQELLSGGAGVGERGQGALGNAGALGSSFNNSMRPTDDGIAGPSGGGGTGSLGRGAGAGGAGGAAGGPGAARGAAGGISGTGGLGPSAGSGDPSNPASSADLALAASSGYSDSFNQLGLKVGRGPDGRSGVLRADGSPASPGELARLREQIQSDPQALMRRPDFFSVLSREKFGDLRKDYSGRPELRDNEFKDVGMTEKQRDFQYAASCDKLSGDCNKSAKKGSYRRGQDVPPEDLADIWKRIKEEAKSYEVEQSLARRQNPASKGRLGGLGAKIGGMLDGLAGLFGGGGASGSAVSGSNSGRGRQAGVVFWGGWFGRRARAVEAGRPASAAQGLIVSEPAAPSTAGAAPKARGPSALFWSLLAGGGFILLVAILRRRRRRQADH